MSDKCLRCGKALVRGYIKDATRDHPAMVCPVHGEDRWFQPCPGAGPHWVAGVEPKHMDLRRCPMIGENVEPKNCAHCNRPALVEAVRAGRKRLVEECDRCHAVEDDEDGNPICPGCEAHIIIEEMDTALAALPSEGGESEQG